MADTTAAGPSASTLDGAQALAHRLFERALLRGSFELRSGATTDRYFDKYRATTDPRLLRELGAALAQLARAHAGAVDCIVAPALGAVPLATVLSLELELPFGIVRGSGKEYGTAQQLEGTVRSGWRAVLVEDVVTSGGAAVDALASARAAGLHVDTALCVLDRDGGGREALAGQQVSLHSLLDRRDLDAAFDAGIGVQA